MTEETTLTPDLPGNLWDRLTQTLAEVRRHCHKLEKALQDGLCDRGYIFGPAYRLKLSNGDPGTMPQLVLKRESNYRDTVLLPPTEEGHKQSCTRLTIGDAASEILERFEGTVRTGPPTRYDATLVEVVVPPAVVQGLYKLAGSLHLDPPEAGVSAAFDALVGLVLNTETVWRMGFRGEGDLYFHNSGLEDPDSNWSRSVMRLGREGARMLKSPWGQRAEENAITERLERLQSLYEAKQAAQAKGAPSADLVKHEYFATVRILDKPEAS